MTAMTDWRLPDLNPAQVKFIDSIFSNAFTLFVAGWGTGKTLGGVYASFKLIWRWLPGFDGAWCAQTFGTLERSLIYEWEKQIPKNRYKINRNKAAPYIECYGVRLPDGSPVKRNPRIWLLSGEGEAALESTNLGWIGADEIQQTEVDFWQGMASRMRSKVGDFGTRQWGLGLAESETWLHDVLEINPNPAYHWVKGTPRDNQINLADDYVGNLEDTLSDDMKESRVEGKFSRGEGYVYRGFSRVANVSSDVKYNVRLPIISCQDFNVEPMTTVFGQYDKQADLITWLDEIIEPGSTDDQAVRMADWCKADKYSDGMSKTKLDHSNRNQIYCVPDANSGRSRQQAFNDTNIKVLKNNGFTVISFPFNPSKEDTDNEVRVAICDGKQARHMMFHPRCKKAIESMAMLKKKGRDNSKYSHATDAIRYGVHHMRPINLEKLRTQGRAKASSTPSYGVNSYGGADF